MSAGSHEVDFAEFRCFFGGMSSIANCLVEETWALSAKLGAERFAAPVEYVYNPLDYARAVHETYLRSFANGRKRVIFLGMNPGPFGMAQTGVPFGEVAAVRDFMKISGMVGKPPREHPAKTVDGFACKRSEVSGRRLWGLFAERFGSAKCFFEEHYVHNYCPLLFLQNTKQGKNLSLDQLRVGEQDRVNVLCDAFLRVLVTAMQPEFVIGVGGFAERRAREAVAGFPVRIG
ncbi:MAG: single-stranded DNA-binding protein, partial [Puniceicoccales bacterium]|nr:single-stranded DNA-binding protein [Puniceicoccales bacterium]